MNKNYIKICIDDTYISKDSENQFSENFDNNIIVEFKNDSHYHLKYRCHQIGRAHV